MSALDDIFTAFAPGSKIEGKYRVKSGLGRGGMGLVVLAADLVLGRDVAIKAVLPAPDEDAAAFRRLFRAEAAIMAQLRSEHVAQVYSFGEHCGYPFFAMEYVPGENLGKFMARNGPVPLDVAVGILEQVCEGLDAVHAKGIAHRDIKPDNLIVGPDYRVCLVDFGVAGAPTDGSCIYGTPAYIAPELLDGSKLPAEGQRLCDLYSLAICAYQLITGQPPIDLPRDPGAALLAKLHQEPIRASWRLAGLLPVVDDVLARALARDPAQRYQSAQDLRRALRGMLQQSARGGPRILLVDDDPMIRTLYTAVLQGEFAAAEIDSAGDGLIAFEMAKARQPDLIVVDLAMPRVDGRQLCRHLKATDSLSQVPIVVISADADQETRAELLELGVSDALRKPVSSQQLTAVVTRHLHG